jgi:cyclase
MSTSMHGHGPLGPAELVEVADRVFAYCQPDGSWWVNNTGFVVGRSAVVSVDACATERRTRAYLDRIATVTSAPVRQVVNTHHHGDHTFGNSFFTGATIIGHERCRSELLAAGLPADLGIWEPVDWGALELAPPTVTFSDRIRVWSDDSPLDVAYVGGPAHTTNDCLVWLPESEVLFCGDLLFSGGTPFLLMGSLTGAISVLTTKVAPIPARVIVPGHGLPCDHELVETTVGYLRFVLDAAARGRDAGLTPLETALETDLGDYAGWLDPERLVGNLHRAYADLAGEGEPRDVDVLGALRDMVAFNGGRALSCYA